MSGETMSTPFPSLVISADGFEAQGSFAESQATFLNPDPKVVSDLRGLLEAKNAGVVAHFYMDAELQGVLTACDWPHIFISDSLAMADAAVRMAEAGVKAVFVLGVDFMSENVRAVMDHAGFGHVPVYRLATDAIGCSLAESAQGPAYKAWLEKAAQGDNALHVIYINTGLDVKARAHAVVPTITCTSSNVVQTILQADSQIPGLRVHYGPDTYMGENLRVLFGALAQQSDADIAALHPAHDQASVKALLERLDVFPNGNCVVHHMFGDAVAKQVEEDYGDCYITAHLEVPGEMFAIGARAQAAGTGVVGSTSNILGFIRTKLNEALGADEATRLRFVLGTEAGMLTAIVKAVRSLLQASGRTDVDVEIIFPVAQEVAAQTDVEGLGILPAVAGGEGCSTAGGCASCPFMKMNELEGLFELLESLGSDRDLSGFHPKVYSERLGDRSLAEVGTEPILHMRHFQRSGEMAAALVDAVTA